MHSSDPFQTDHYHVPQCATTWTGFCAPGLAIHLAGMEWVDQGTGLNTDGRVMSCMYDQNIFADEANVTAWNNFYVNSADNPALGAINSKVYNDQVLATFCTQPADPGACNNLQYAPSVSGFGPCTGGLTGCSRMSSNTGCIQWVKANDFGQNSIVQSAFTEYCSQDSNVCSNDCRCINRAVVDEVYIDVVKGGAPPN